MSHTIEVPVLHSGLFSSDSPRTYPLNAHGTMLVNTAACYPFYLAPVLIPRAKWLGIGPVLFGLQRRPLRLSILTSNPATALVRGCPVNLHVRGAETHYSFPRGVRVLAGQAVCTQLVPLQY